MPTPASVRAYLLDHRPAAKALNLTASQVSAAEIAEAGRGDANIAYRVRAADTDAILRVMYHSAQGIGLAASVQREASVLRYLSARNVTGALYYVDVERGVEGLPLLAMEYLPGRAMDYRESDLAAAGALYARLHETPGEPPASISRVTDPRAPYLAEIRRWLERHAAWRGHDPAVHRELASAAQRCEQRELPSGPAILIHGDGTDHNWRVTGADARILDWDWCRVTHAAADLGHFLSPVTTLRHEGRLLSKAEEQLVLDAYFAGRPGLDPARFTDELHRIRALVITHSATWTGSFMAELAERNERPEKVARLATHIRPDFLARLREDGIF